MEQVNEVAVKTALTLIIRNKDKKALNYAVNYAAAGRHMTGEELRVQCLYVLNNIQYWRGAEAKTVRRILKLYTKNK